MHHACVCKGGGNQEWKDVVDALNVKNELNDRTARKYESELAEAGLGLGGMGRSIC